MRRVDQIVASGKLFCLLELLDQETDQRAFRMPEDQACADLIVDRKQIELSTEPPVITSLRFFQPVR